METYAIKNLTFSYPEQQEKALRNVELSVRQGDFCVICGPSGCGKSTLLRLLKPALAPHGVLEGSIFFEGAPLQDADGRTQAQKIGFVQQSPENQVVTDKVWHELAFGLESLGYDTPTIRRRVAEMAAFFGMETWFYKNVAELSGGQKQLLNLAAVMVMQPSVLILDEPTSQLDPIAASDFLATLGKVNRELGTTVILTEHRLEEAFPLATKVAVMERGSIVCTGTAAEVGKLLRSTQSGMFRAMPTAMRVWAAADGTGQCPVTVRDGRQWLQTYAQEHTLQPLPEKPVFRGTEQTVISAREVFFRYEKDEADVLRGLSLQVQKGEFLAVLGGNGAGKSTMLKVLSGLEKPQRGQVEVRGKTSVLPQDPKVLFAKKTVREDLAEVLMRETENLFSSVVHLCRLETLLERHPYDLSGGEMQRCALAKILLLQPEILLLDEPTKGLDAEFKDTFAVILQKLQQNGVTVVMVSHDVEFCAQYAGRCAMFFDGGIVAQAPPGEFFSMGSFYTTSANRMARDILPDAVTAEDLIAACGGVLPPRPEVPETSFPPLPEAPQKEAKKLPLWRKILAWLAGLGSLGLFAAILGQADLSALLTADGLSPTVAKNLPLYGAFFLCLLLLAVLVSRKSEKRALPVRKKKLSPRTALSAALILLLIPLTLFVGQTYLGGRKYYAVSLAILLEIMIPFFLVFEGRKPQARELVIVAVLCAMGVAGRAAFFMLPQFKPVIALTIVAGVAFGGETGFLVGAMTMLASNVLLGQGPWTPWQMFAMGIIGFLAGVLFRKGLLHRSRVALSVFGALAALVIYGGIMNPASALLSSAQINGKVLAAYFVSGLPMDCMQAAATWLFLWFAAEPMLEKLDRIKVKYGLVEA